MQNEEQQNGVIRKVLRNEITSVFGIVITIFSFVMFVIKPQQQNATNILLIQASIQKIEENHLTHLQGYAEQLLEIKQECDKRQEQYLTDTKENQKEHLEILRNLDRALTIAEK